MRKNRNIWIINQYCGSPYHGMNYRSYYLAKEFVDGGDDVTIFTGSYSHLFSKFPETRGVFTTESIDNIDYIWVKTPKYKNSKSLGRVFNMLSFSINLLFFNIFKKNKPDIIIISSLSLFPIINSYIWSKLFKIEFILEVRDIWPLTLIELGNKSRYHPLVLFFGWFEKFGYKKAKYVVSLLPRAKDHMVSRGMKENKFRSIPNGINLAEVRNYHDLSDNILNMIPKDKFIVGYVGTIGIANALEYFLEAAKKMKNQPQVHFVIVGKGGEKFKLQEFCKFNQLGNVTFIDPIPKTQVQAMLNLFNACYIGFLKHDIYKHGVSANKIFDYMYSAKPIIFAIESEHDLISDANCGISISPESSNEIIEAITKLTAMDVNELCRLGENGKDYVIKHHSYKNLSNLYKKIM